MTSKKIATQIRLDEALYEQVKSIAEAEMRSVNAQMEYFIKTGVLRYRPLATDDASPEPITED